MSDIINTAELMERLGISSLNTLKIELDNGLPFFMVGKTKRYDWDAVINYLSNKQKGKK